MAKNKKYRAAVIGCGRIASLFAKDNKRKGAVTHAQAYLSHPRVTLVAASDLNPERLESFGETWNVTKLYSSYTEMLAQEKIDIVSICTPTAAHYQVCKDALASGVKALFCEKPMAASLAEADDLEKWVKKSGAVFAVNHSRRWDQFEQKIAAHIAAGKLGSIQSIDAYYTAGIANTGSHLFDLLLMLSGSTVKTVQAIPNLLPGTDPTVDIILKMASGFQCFIHGLNVKDYLMFEIDIYGTKGRLRILDSGFSAQYWAALPHKTFSGYHQLIPAKHSFGSGYQRVLSNAVSDIVHALDTGKKTASSLTDGLRVLEIISAVHLSLKQKGKPVHLPLTTRKIKIG